jgi:hypothetical protein
LTLASVETSRDCPGDTGSYRVELEEEGGLTFLAADTDECPSRSDALDDSTISPTQAPTSVVDPRLDQTTQALVDQFVAIYNAGNAEAFAAFLHPDFERLITRERIAEPQPQEPVLVLYGVDAALNMEVTLACTATPSQLLCDVTKYDDLHRVLGIEASPDRRWTLTFEDGLLRTWGEHRENQAVDYEIEAITPFLDWMRENHPQVPSLFPFVDGDWTVRDGIGEDVANFVAEWAASRGVDLDG